MLGAMPMMCFNLRIESLVIERQFYCLSPFLLFLHVSISELRVLLLRAQHYEARHASVEEFQSQN